MFTMEETQAIWQARRAEEQTLSTAMHAAEHLVPVPMLQELRTLVFALNRKRLPKWRFRQPDRPTLVIQLQPIAQKHFPSWLFEGHAIQGEGITRTTFTEPGGHVGLASWWFRLVTTSEGWEVEGHGHSIRPLAEMVAFKADVVALLRALTHLQAVWLLEPYCLLCGKSLTDPISQARGIGPECARHIGLGSGIYARLFQVPQTSLTD
jgi:hypothetical protein